MIINNINESQQQAARIAGFTILFAMAIVVFGEFFLSANLIVPGNAVDTARNILAHQTIFRTKVACDLIYVANLVVLLSMLYIILKPVHHSFALAATFLRLIYIMLWVVTALNMLGALNLLSDAAYLHV